MTGLLDALETLRAAVSESAVGGVGRDAVTAALDTAAFRSAEVVTVPGEGSVDFVSVVPAGEVRLSDLEAVLGPASRLPLGPSIGEPASVQFDATVPGDGSAGATVLAEVDEEDLVTRLIVRADRF